MKHYTSEVAEVLNWTNAKRQMAPAIVFPFVGPNGSLGYSRLKPDCPRTIRGQNVKYESPRGRTNEIYIPPGTLSVIGDVHTPLMLTEGEKKALAADQAGFACISLVGVFGWKQPGQESLISSLARLPWEGRDVYIAFDSDIADKPEVQAAESRLALLLKQRGAVVKVIRLPAGPAAPNGVPTKVGLDDFIVANGVEALRALITTAVEPSLLSSAAMKVSAREVDPCEIVREYLNGQESDGTSKLVNWRNVWWEWGQGRYREKSDGDVRADLVRHLNSQLSGLGTKQVADYMMHLRAEAALSSEVESPCWLGSEESFWQPDQLLPCKNQIIHLPSLIAGESYSRPATPLFFSTAALDFDFDLGARCPQQWLEFLGRLWGNDRSCIEALQEWFGYFLTPDTSQHKILSIIGPRRSGKGTIARILTRLVGARNVVGPTLSSLTTNFGLAPLVGKTLAVVADARLSNRSDSAALIERLLSISGEDTLTIDRKNQSAITCKLPTRIMLLTNEMPRLTDASNALAGRIVFLPMTESWYGREDTTLTDRLLPELPGILIWAIEGWQRLRDRGHFVEPSSAVSQRDDYERLASPVAAFVNEVCRRGPDVSVARQELYEAYRRWCISAGQHAKSQPQFATDLRASVQGLQDEQSRLEGGRRERRYVGIGLLPTAESGTRGTGPAHAGPGSRSS